MTTTTNPLAALRTLARATAAAVTDTARKMRATRALGPYVTVFASSRFAPPDPTYAMARELGRRLAEAGHAVMTGGGTGLMEAVNRGAREAGGRSLGCRAAGRRGGGQVEENRYLDLCVELEQLTVRKALLLEGAAYLALPGGFGTLDELFEALALMQAGKVAPREVLLIGRAFWQPLCDFLGEEVLGRGAIDAMDLSRLVVLDDLDEVVARLSRRA